MTNALLSVSGCVCIKHVLKCDSSRLLVKFSCECVQDCINSITASGVKHSGSMDSYNVKKKEIRKILIKAHVYC